MQISSERVTTYTINNTAKVIRESLFTHETVKEEKETFNVILTEHLNGKGKVLRNQLDFIMNGAHILTIKNDRSIGWHIYNFNNYYDILKQVIHILDSEYGVDLWGMLK